MMVVLRIEADIDLDLEYRGEKIQGENTNRRADVLCGEGRHGKNDIEGDIYQ